MKDSLLPQPEDVVIFNLSGYYGELPRNLKRDIELAKERFGEKPLAWMRDLFEIPVSQRDKWQNDKLYDLLTDLRKHISGTFTENTASIVTGQHFHATCNTYRNVDDVGNLEIRSDADPGGIDWGRNTHYKGRSCDQNMPGYDKNNTTILVTGVHLLTPDLTRIVGEKEKQVLTSSYEEAMDWAYSAKMIIYLYGTCRVGTVRFLKEEEQLKEINKRSHQEYMEAKLDWLRAKLNGEEVGEFSEVRKTYTTKDLGSGNADHLLLNNDGIIYFPRNKYLNPLDKTKDVVMSDRVAQKFIVPYEKLEDIISAHRYKKS